jgi:hypothetical protein
MFRLYWFDTRDGAGYPAIDYPDAMPYEAALKAKGGHYGRVRHPKDFRLELRYEPVDLGGVLYAAEDILHNPNKIGN